MFPYRKNNVRFGKPQRCKFFNKGSRKIKNNPYWVPNIKIHHSVQSRNQDKWMFKQSNCLQEDVMDDVEKDLWSDSPKKVMPAARVVPTVIMHSAHNKKQTPKPYQTVIILCAHPNGAVYYWLVLWTQDFF